MPKHPNPPPNDPPPITDPLAIWLITVDWLDEQPSCYLVTASTPLEAIALCRESIRDGDGYEPDDPDSYDPASGVENFHATPMPVAPDATAGVMNWPDTAKSLPGDFSNLTSIAIESAARATRKAR